jgi:hypothetical protein
MFFGNMGLQYIYSFKISIKMNLLNDTFPMGYYMPKMNIICKSYDHEKLKY